MLQQVVEENFEGAGLSAPPGRIIRPGTSLLPFFIIAAINLILWVKFVCSYYMIFDPFRNSCAYAYPHAILASLFHRWFEYAEAQAPVDSE
jgi:hypothetical protein